MILENLCNEIGISGHEEKIRKIIYNEISNTVNDIRVDTLGNLYAYKKGKNNKHIMLCAHMDEVGFVVKEVLDDGAISFASVGGIDSRILPSKSILIGEQRIPGIIGVKPIHLQTEDERTKVIKEEDLFIDIGTNSKEETLKYVNLGDYISFNSRFEFLTNKIAKSKALDDRVGCSVLIEILKQNFECCIIAVFTVQEEVGLRGASVAGFNLKPDYAIIVEGTTASDVSGVEEYEYITSLGKGPAISILDGGSYSNKELVSKIVDSANKNNIKFQYKKGTTGGNDAGKIQISDSGIKTAVISVPCRYIHSPSSVINIEDYENTKKLVQTVLSEIK